MNYGSCACCPAACAAWSLSQNAIELVPECVLLCPDHLRLLSKRRAEAATRDARNAARRYCACGNEILLRPDERTTCAACITCAASTVNRHFGDLPEADRRRMAGKVPEDWYSSKACREPGCGSRMIYWYPALGVAMCDKHGAKPEPEGAHA